MFGAPFRLPAMVRSMVASLGLVLMVVCVFWLESIPRPPAALTKSGPATRQPFPTVVLDPGHGGQDSGAMCAGVLEKDLTLDVAKRLERLLQAQGLTTVMTRPGDAYVSLVDRAALVNRVEDCVFVSIHFNEGNKPVSSGVETYYAEHQMSASRALVAWIPFLQSAGSEVSNVESQSLAAFIQESLVARTHAVNRGTKGERFYVISNVRHPAVLVEGGFLSNKDDIAKLASEDYREQIAAAIDEGIQRYRDLLKNRNATPALAPPEGTE